MVEPRSFSAGLAMMRIQLNTRVRANQHANSNPKA